MTTRDEPVRFAAAGDYVTGTIHGVDMAHVTYVVFILFCFVLNYIIGAPSRRHCVFVVDVFFITSNVIVQIEKPFLFRILTFNICHVKLRF